MSERMIFCVGEGRLESKGTGYQKNNMAWNKPVTNDRYEEILKEVREILPAFKLDARENWTDEWKKVTAGQWAKLSKIPEFDIDITILITGLSKIDIEEEKTIEIEGKNYTISEIKSALLK